MARPNVTVKVIDESLVAPIGENTSPGIGAVVSRQGLVHQLGVTAEKQGGLMIVENLSDWFGKLRYRAELDLIAAGITGGTLQAYIGASAANFVNPLSAEKKSWYKEWWAVHNFLQYGGRCAVGGTGTDPSVSQVTTSLSSPTVGYDVLFCGDTGNTNISDVKTVVDARSQTEIPVLGVVYAGEPTGHAKVDGTSSQFYVNVAGSKYHLNAVGQGDLDGDKLILTNLTPDVAGCITRCDRDSYPWFSPAGRRRGRILNVVRLYENPTASLQDTMYDGGVNPVVTFPGEGTILFGDKTGEADTSTLSRINVSRLFIYLRKVINPIARAILFEINDVETRSQFILAASTVMDQVQGQRGITDYRIICDESNNPPQIVQSRLFVADILVKPTIAVNYVRITFTNKNLFDDLGSVS
jgi:hypothetical protein